MSRKTIQLPEDKQDEDQPEREDFLPIAFVDLNAPAEGRENWQVVAKDEHGNKLYAPPSRYSIWHSFP